MRKLTLKAWSNWVSVVDFFAAICLALVLSGTFDPTALLAETEPDSPAASTATQPPEAKSSPAPAQPADAAESPSKPLTDVEPAKLLSDARAQLIRYQPIQATIVETVAIGDRKFKARGTYLQGNDLKLRLEYEVEVGGMKGTLLEVCDGQVLWSALTFTAPPKPQDVSPADGATKSDAQTAPPAESAAGAPKTTTRITRRDITEILKVAHSGPKIPDSQLTAELGLEGLPGLLASLEQSMQFDSAVEETLNGRTFTVVEGSWKQEFLTQASGKSYKDGLPRHIPDRVRVYLEQDTQFPRRIEYLKQDAGGKFSRPMVTLDFDSVLINAAVSDQSFEYRPPDGAEQNDVTDLFLERLHRNQESQVAPAIPAQ